MQTNDLGISQATAYRHLHRGYPSVNKLDFPRVVEFKARSQPHRDYVPKAAKADRTYADFLDHAETLSISSWVAIDMVIVWNGGKVIMIFAFTFCNFMFGLLLDDKTAAEVTLKIRALKEMLVKSGFRFGGIFPLLPTDNDRAIPL